MAGRPVPPKRRDLMTESGVSAKMDLVDSFAGFSATTVSERHMQLARDCIAKLPARSARYELVPFHMMLQWNQEKPNYLSMIAQACDLLLKYVINLLKPKRPQVWRSIKTTNSHFCARVDCMEGARRILKEIGYSEDKTTAMQFPDSVEEPDKQKLHIIAAELLMAKLEVEEQMRNPNQSLSRQGSNPPSQPSPTQQPRVSHVTPVTSHGGHVTPVTSHGSHMTPVGYPTHEPVKTAMMYNANVPPASNGVPPHSTTSADQLQYQQQTSSAVSIAYANNQSLSSAAPSYPSHVPAQPTAAHVSPYEEPVASHQSPPMSRNAPQPTQAAPPPRVLRTPPVSDSPSLGSSENSNYVTPSSSPHTSMTEEGKPDQVPQPTPESSSGSGSAFAADMRKALEEIKQRKKQIKGDIQKGPKAQSVDQGITVETKSSPGTQRRSAATSMHTRKDVQWSPGGVAGYAPPKRPLKKEHPQFASDPIPEEPLPTSSSTVASPTPAFTATPPPVKPLFCSNCGNKLSSEQCTYCSSPAASHPTSSMLPPPCSPAASHPTSSMLPPPIVSTATGLARMDSEEPKPKPMRASAASAEEAMQQHRKTQAFNVSTQGPHGVGAGPGAMPGSSAGIGGSGATGVEGGAVGGGDKTFINVLSEKERAWKEECKKRGYRDDEIPAEPGAMPGPGAGAGGVGGSGVGGSGVGGSGVGGSGASWETGPEGGAVGGGESTFIKMVSEKERRWKEDWRKRGYRDDEIPAEPGSTPLPPPKVPEQTKKPVGRDGRKGKKPHHDPSKSATGDLDRYKREAEQQLVMDKMAQDGQVFMECVKLCVQHGYSLEEVDLAYRNTDGPNKQKEVLGYLKGAWVKKIRELQRCVHDMIDANGQTVGYPSDLEARKHLVQENGDVMRASLKVYIFRKKKIEELQSRFQQIHVECKLRELEWKGAVHALSAFDMDIDKAYWSIQCEVLEPMYEFIFSEWNHIAATDMKNIKALLKKEKEGPGKEATMRLLMGEFKLETMEKAQMVIALMNEIEIDASLDYPLSYYVDAAKDYSSLEVAERCLIKDCPICYVSYPVHEMIIMPGCTDSLCKDCFKQHFKVTITEKGVKHFNCPQCDKPDMTERDDAQDLYQELFVHLIHEHLPEQYGMVQHKLTERNLQKEPGFRWCVNEKCGNCFINPNLNRKKVQCPSCQELMCFQCQKPWEDQHDTLSCVGFAEWKRNNDPNFQKEGLAAHLQANGIECPDCHMRYELARGGCMHFKCTRCPNEFCSGCGGSFKKAEACGRFQSCAARGLHAHHPRDCLYYMRDFNVDELQEFLRQNNIEFQTTPAETKEEDKKEGEGDGDEKGKEEAVEGQDGAKAAEAEEGDVLRCSAMLQKETPDKLIDEACGDAVKEGHAGLCEKHYKEYLVDRLNKAKLDPLPMYDTDKIIVILKREEKAVPEREDETDDEYRKKIIDHVKEELPLQRGEAAAGERPAPAQEQELLVADGPAQPAEQ